uniref:Matrix-remodeling-associated protein 7 helical domain-containing protein n=1 Tax=Wuchereria bancrofti TaxID=6293 RepID=A0A1I8EGV5_WUCBA
MSKGYLMEMMVMHTYEDYDESNPDTVLHSLPPYSYASFFQEYPKMCIVITAFCAFVVSMYFWGLFRIRREELNIALNGRFSSAVLSRVQWRFTNKNIIDTTLEVPLCNEESFKSGTWNNFCNNELNEAVGPFNEFYGKLATAKLRAKIRKLEETMTDEERREEQLIQQKQLESICEMIMHEPEKFGLHDKSEVTEQMKLYSVT